MNASVWIFILLLSFSKVHSQSVDFNENDNWQFGHHPFPEMSRFLNSYSRIHYQSLRKTSTSRITYSLQEYICSIADDSEHIEEILIIFGENYRSLIETIIEYDCPRTIRDSEMTININERKYPRRLYRYSRRRGQIQSINDII